MTATTKKRTVIFLVVVPGTIHDTGRTSRNKKYASPLSSMVIRGETIGIGSATSSSTEYQRTHNPTFPPPTTRGQKNHNLIYILPLPALHNKQSIQ
jgi:hypothetical protein